MNDISPSFASASDLQHVVGNGKIFWNLSASELIDHAVKNKDGSLTHNGALTCFTGKHTGRSPKDKFTVKDHNTDKNVDWGAVNQALTPAHFEALRKDQQKYLQGKNLYVVDAYAGAEQRYRTQLRCINEDAWSNLFAKQLFIRPQSTTELKSFTPSFLIIHTPGFLANPSKHGTNTETFIVVNFTEKIILIGGTKYAGEMKKSIFSVLNYLLPLQGVLSMHCSANISKKDSSHVALFFGLSGTGKTTLSADPERLLIGDDEHGWSEQGVFNFEGGCYAKCVNLSKEREPQIWNAIREGAILENVIVDPKTGTPDFNDVKITENTRAAYPLEHIEGAVPSGMGPHPKDIVFLTCDAFGVMPPIAKLSTSQAMYHFLSGYTAKVAGTEQGMGSTPQTTFSACFGSPFLPLKPTAYADLLGKKMNQHKVNCWLINTGWSGGGVGVGSRIKLDYTRRMVRAALDGELRDVKFIKDPIFGLAVPEHITGLPDDVLNPRSSWKDKKAYDDSSRTLAGKFVENFKRFLPHAPSLESSGPVLSLGSV